MLQMSSVMNEFGGGPPARGFPGMGGGGLGGLGGFGGAANPTTAPNPATNTNTPDPTTNTNTPGTTPSTTGTADTTGTPPGQLPPNPFFDQAIMEEWLGRFTDPNGGGSFGGFGGLLGGPGGGLFGPPATPAATGPPEERFQTQLQVSILWGGRAFDPHSESPAAIERDGFLQRLTEHPCPPSDGRKRSRRHRVHSRRRRLVSLLIVKIGSKRY